MHLEPFHRQPGSSPARAASRLSASLRRAAARAWTQPAPAREAPPTRKSLGVVRTGENTDPARGSVLAVRESSATATPPGNRQRTGDCQPHRHRAECAGGRCSAVGGHLWRYVTVEACFVTVERVDVKRSDGAKAWSRVLSELAQVRVSVEWEGPDVAGVLGRTAVGADAGGARWARREMLRDNGSIAVVRLRHCLVRAPGFYQTFAFRLV